MRAYFSRKRSKEQYFRFQEIAARALLDYLKSKGIEIEGKRILDCGSSLGGYTKVFSEGGGSVLPFDIDKESLIYLRERVCAVSKNPCCVLGDATAMPFKNSSFDLVIAVSLIEHLPEQEEFLKEAYRCAVGYLLVTFPPYYSLLGGHALKPFHLLPEKLAIRVGRGLRIIDKNVETLKDISLFPLTISRALRMMEKVGFEIASLDSRYTSSFFCRFRRLREFLVPHCIFLLKRHEGGER
ncbi:MAG: methyltransferase domain-containing protein [Thermoplasmata archaeon]